MACGGEQLYRRTLVVQADPQAVVECLVGLPSQPVDDSEVFFLGLSLQARAGAQGANYDARGGESAASDVCKSNTTTSTPDQKPCTSCWTSDNTYWITRRHISMSTGPDARGSGGMQAAFEFGSMAAWRRRCLTGSDGQGNDRVPVLSLSAAGWGTEAAVSPDHGERLDQPNLWHLGYGPWRAAGSSTRHCRRITLTAEAAAGGGVAMFLRFSLPASSEVAQGRELAEQGGGAGGLGAQQTWSEDAQESAAAQRVLVCSANFVTLLPGDRREIEMWVHASELPRSLIVSGFNLAQRAVPITWV